MASGSLTSRALTETYLARIETFDPALGSVLQTDPDAFEIADALDAERRSGRIRGPLHGIPVLVKDNIDSADRMRTTAGSFALGEVTPAHDAAVVARFVRRARWSWASQPLRVGELPLDAFEQRVERPRRPCVTRTTLDRSPCGSSSGSGVAVSASLCAVAVGTETDGSIICHRRSTVSSGSATVGLVSRSGVIPVSHSQDTPGPMARTVADAAALLTALAGADERDAATIGAHVEADYAAFVDPDGLRGARIGVVRNLAGFNDRVDRLFEDALGAMRELGAEIVDPADIPHVDELEDSRARGAPVRVPSRPGVVPRVARPCPAAPDARRPDRVRRGARGRRDAVLRAGAVRAGRGEGSLTEPAYLEAFEKCRRLSRAEGIDAVMDEHRLDALVAPSNAPAWRIDHANGDHDVGGNSTPAAVAGYPNYYRPDGVRVPPPDRDLVHGACLERGEVDPAGVGLRARHAPPSGTEPRHGPRTGAQSRRRVGASSS